jgi:hypothetical protein
VTFSSGMTNTYTGTFAFIGTGTLTTAGKTLANVTVNGAGITVTLGDALTSTGTLTVTQGTFDTAGYSVTAVQLASLVGNVRTILLRSSTVTLSGALGVNITDGTNLTFTAGTSTIVLTADGATLANNAVLTFYDISFTNTAIFNARGLAAGSTQRNITIAAPASDGVMRFSIPGNATITGTLSVTGSTSVRRIYFFSNTVGTARTLTVAALSADHCDFEDITLAGAASPASPTGAGNCGGNTNITFPAAKTVYRVGTDTTWAGSSSWATSSNGTGSDANFPLPQDTAVIDNATTGASLTFVAAYNRSAVDMSSRTTPFTIASSGASSFYGSFLLGSGASLGTLTATQTYRGRYTSTLTTAGKTLNCTIILDALNGTLQLGSALSSTASLSMGRGTFDAVSYNVTLGTFASVGSGIRTVSMGSGLWTLTSTGTVWNATATNFTLNKDTADVLLSNTSAIARSVSAGALSFNKLTIGGATGSSTTNLSTLTLTELASTKTVAHTITITATAAATIGTWSVTGTAGNVVTLNSNVVGTQRTIALTNVTSGIDYLAVKDIGVTVANRFYVGANSTDNGNNTNVIFTAAPGGTFVDAAAAVTVSTAGTAFAVLVQGAAAAASVTSTVAANAVKVFDSSAASSAASSTTAAAIPIRQVSAAPNVTSTVTAAASGLFGGSAAASCDSSTTANAAGLFATSALSSISVIVTANAIRQWDPEPPQGEIWTPQSEASETWTPQDASGSTWTQAA